METVVSFTEKFYRKVINSLTGSDPTNILKTSLIYILGNALAVPLYYLQQALLHYTRNSLPDNSPEQLLERQGNNLGVQRNNGSFFQGFVSVTFNEGGGTIDPNAILVAANGQRFFIASGQTLSTTSTTLSLRIISENVGVQSNLEVDSELTLNIENESVQTLIINQVLREGRDRENLEDYRRRVIEAYRRKPYAGTAADFKNELELLDYVSRLFVITTPGGVGSVSLYPINYDATGFLVSTLQINEIIRRCFEVLTPSYVNLSVQNPTQVSINLEIQVETGLDTDTNTQNRIKEALQVYLQENAKVRGSFKDGTNTETGQITALGIISALANVQGFTTINKSSLKSEALTTFNLSTNFTPSADGEILVLGDVTFA